MADYERRPHEPTGGNEPEKPDGKNSRTRMMMPRRASS